MVEGGASVEEGMYMASSSWMEMSKDECDAVTMAGLWMASPSPMGASINEGVASVMVEGLSAFVSSVGALMVEGVWWCCNLRHRLHGDGPRGSWSSDGFPHSHGGSGRRELTTYGKEHKMWY